MTVCWNPWGEATLSPINIDAVGREHKGQYLVPPDGAMHIVSDAYFGEESAGGTVTVELVSYCRISTEDGTLGLRTNAEPDREVCGQCTKEQLKERTLWELSPEERGALGL